MSNMFRFYSKLQSLDLSSWNVSNVTNMEGMFNCCASLVDLDLTGWDTSKVTNMANMFNSTNLITIPGLESFNTSNVTSFSNMFYNCSSLQSLDLSGWNTSKVTNMECMFRSCTSIETLNLSGWDTSKVTTMEAMFASPGGLSVGVSYYYGDKTVDWVEIGYPLYSGGFTSMALRQINGLASFNTSNVTTMASMFRGCTNMNWLALQSTVAGFDKTKCKYLAYIFAGIPITEFDMSVLGDTRNVRFFGGFFAGSTVEHIKLTFDTSISSTHICCSYMFAGCRNLKTIDLTNFDSSRVFNMGYMFAGCPQLEQIIGLEDLNTCRVYNMAYMFSGTNMFDEFNLNETFQDLSYLNDLGMHEDLREYDALEGMFAGCSSPSGTFKFIFDSSACSRRIGVDGLFASAKYSSIDISELDTTNVASLSYMFIACKNLANVNSIIGLSTLDTLNITDMSYMFAATNLFTTNDDSVSQFDFSIFSDVRNLKTIEGMFSQITAKKFQLVFNTQNLTGTISLANLFVNCADLTDLNLSRLDTTNVSNINNMYAACPKLVSLNIDHFKTNNLKSMHGMFANCTTLTTISMRNAKTGNVSDMSYMFYGCSSIQTLNVRNFETNSVTNMSNMFYGCSSLLELDIKSFSTSNVTNMSSMFYNCSKLERIQISSKFSTTKVTAMNNMFANCAKLASINLTFFDTQNVNTMESMFYGCKALENLDFSSFNTNKVNNFTSMFNGCSALVEIDLSSFSTSNAYNFNAMFNGCSKLETITFGDNFKTTRGSNFSSMFNGCEKLQDIDFSGFESNSVNNVSYMFNNCKLIENIDFSKMRLSSIVNAGSINGFINGCTSLLSISLPKSFPIMRSDAITSYGNLNDTFYVNEYAPLFSGTKLSDFTDFLSSDDHVFTVVKFDAITDCILSANIRKYATDVFSLNIIVEGDDTFKALTGMTFPIPFSLTFNDPQSVIENEYITITEDGGTFSFSVKYGLGFTVRISLLCDESQHFNLVNNESLISTQKVQTLPRMDILAEGDINVDLYATQVFTVKAQLLCEDEYESIGEEQKVIYGGQIETPFEIVSGNGYQFVGWRAEDEEPLYEIESPEEQSTLVKNIYQDATITALLDIETYKIVLKVDGNEEVIEYTIKSDPITLEAPSKFGYDFEGWTGSNGRIPRKEIVIRTGSYGDREYVANWRPDQKVINIIIISVVSVIVVGHVIVILSIVLYKHRKKKQVVTISLDNLKKK